LFSCSVASWSRFHNQIAVKTTYSLYQPIFQPCALLPVFGRLNHHHCQAGSLSKSACNYQFTWSAFLCSRLSLPEAKKGRALSDPRHAVRMHHSKSDASCGAALSSSRSVTLNLKTTGCIVRESSRSVMSSSCPLICRRMLIMVYLCLLLHPSVFDFFHGPDRWHNGVILVPHRGLIRGR
jgi:hypothetical protein